MDRARKSLERNRNGNPQFPDPVPTDPQDLLDLMDDASKYASAALSAGTVQFDHGMRLFNQLNAHYQIRIIEELSKAHLGLKTATEALKVATWWLAIITFSLGAVELLKLFAHH